MSTAKRIVIASALLLVVAISLWVTNRPEPDAIPVTEVIAIASTDAVIGSVEIEEQPPVVEPPLPNDNCLTPQQLESHPLLVADVMQLEPLLIFGPSIEAYRGLGESDVLSFAAQNDSAAMAVLGAMAMLRAKDIDEKKAVDYLVSSGAKLWPEMNRAKPAENAAAEYQAAYNWFYKAALHGRIFSLTYAGEALTAGEPDLVKSGLISSEDYDALTRSEKAFFNSTNIYTAATHIIAGNPKDGMLGMINGMLPRSEILNAIAVDIAQQYRDDVIAAGLPMVVIPKSEMPPIEEMILMVCEQFRPPKPADEDKS